MNKLVSAGSGIIVEIFIFIVLSCGAFFLLKPATPPGLSTGSFAHTKPHREPAFNKDIPEQPKSSYEQFDDQLVAKLKDLYGDTISDIRVQLKLMKIKRSFISKYPENGERRFNNILQRAFPLYAEIIMDMLNKMEAYLLWESENKGLLSQLNYLEKKALVWEKRQAVFGDAAQEIWSHEMVEKEERQEKVREAISRLKEAYDKPIHENLEKYQTVLADIYEDSPESHILKNKDLLSKMFFGLDSVQSALSEMDEDEQAKEIRFIRESMGYSQNQIEQLEKIDERRNSRWKNGLAYMDERDLVAQNVQGSELENQLKALREKYFKHEARTIELEEKNEFYRYARTRIYGRN